MKINDHSNDCKYSLPPMTASMSLALILCFSWATHAVDQGVGGGRPANKATKDKPFLDPALTSLEGQLTFDEQTKEALQRGGAPGVLVAERPVSGHVFRIEIVGAKKTEPDAVALRLWSKIGEPFNPVLVSQDIFEIMKMGLFSDVNVWHRRLPSGALVLRYELKEVPTIFQIKIVGNEVLSDAEIKESITGLERYQVASPARLRESTDKIRDFLVSKGFFLAEVSYQTKKTKQADINKGDLNSVSVGRGKTASDIDAAKAIAPDFVDVIFVVNENQKVKINRISFSGNFHVEDDIFLKNLRSKTHHLLSVMNDWGTFRKDYLEVDLLIIEKILHDHGYLQAKVLDPDIEISRDKNSIDINFGIIENSQYSMGEIDVIGDRVERSEVIHRLQKETYPDEAVFLASDLASLITLKYGEPFNKSVIAQNVLAIAEKYREEGFAYVNVSPVPKFNNEKHIIDLSVQVESGPRVDVEKIQIEGNDKTTDEVIRRELAIFEGDRYSSSLITLSQHNVQRLGFFETVEFTSKSGSAPDKMILMIKVKEQNTGTIQLSAGYGTGGEGLILRGQITNQNFLGRGQTLSASVNWSNYRRMIDVTFIEPYLTYIFDSPLTFAFTAYNRNMFLGEFNRKSFGGDITLGYPLGGPFVELSRRWKKNVRPSLMPYVPDFEALSFLLTYTAEQVTITDSAADVRKWSLNQGVPRYTTSLRPTIRLDQRDNRLFPSRGYYFEVRSEIATAFLGGGGLASLENYLRDANDDRSLGAGRSYLTPLAQANNFIRYGANFRFYHNLDDWFFLKGLIFKTNFELGLLNTLGKPLTFENFALGGMNSIRGYSYRSISPIERSGALFPFDPRRNFRVGGDKQFYGSLELEFPLIPVLKISGALFFDFGNVFAHNDNFFFIGGKSLAAKRIKPKDPLNIYSALGLYSSVGFGVRWLSPMGLLRFEWGIPLSPRPVGTPGLIEGDGPILFEFNIGSSF